MLRKLTLKGVYKSDQDDILRDFYFPILSVATRFDRAVGYFSASTLSHAGQALSTFINGGGRIRLIVGAFTDQIDIQAISEGLQLKEESARLGSEFIAELDLLADNELFQHRFQALSWLVLHGRLEVRVALRPRGIYHDKVGIITDADGDTIVFAGSANESAAALLPTQNYESIDVFPCWRPELSAWHEPHRASFERLWNNRSKGTVVIDMPTALRDRLLEVASKMDGPPDPLRELEIDALLRAAHEENERNARQTPRGPHIPEEIGGAVFNIKDHQRAALNAWQTKGDYQGIFDLATGAGKTITSVYAVVKLSEAIVGLVVVIAVPYQSLADQWCDVLEMFNIHPLRCYVSKSSWDDQLKEKILAVQTGATKFEAIVVVNRTLKSAEFQSAISRIPSSQFLWIGDECHHHGSESFGGALPENARYRIGLSATPQHYLDDEKNLRLGRFYGETVFKYELKEAIQDGVLTPYDYYPHLVELTETEADDFISLSDDIARLFAREGHASNGGKPSLGLTAMLMKRARLVGSAVNKLPVLRAVLADKQPASHTLFYCGDGQVEYDDDDDGLEDQEAVAGTGRQIEVVSRVLDDAGWRVSRFTAREGRSERDGILRAFKIGLIDGLVAIKCLDEGIDVPACATAYILASSRDPRQFIQRRGRILRKSPGKEFAVIHDFIVILPSTAHDKMGAARKLIAAELKRVAEFSGLARNRFEAYDILRDVLTDYDLEHAI